MPSYAIPAGVALLVLSPLLFYINILLGILGLMAGLVMTFTKVGMEIDTTNKKYRDFYDLCGIRHGEWSSYQDFKHIAFYRKTESTQADPHAFWMLPVYSRTIFYDVYILSEDHLQKRKIWRFMKRQNALKLVKKLSQNLDLEMIQPPAPTRTRNRHRRR